MLEALHVYRTYFPDPQGGMTFHAGARREGLTLQDDPATSSFL